MNGSATCDEIDVCVWMHSRATSDLDDNVQLE